MECQDTDDALKMTLWVSDLAAHHRHCGNESALIVFHAVNRGLSRQAGLALPLREVYWLGLRYVIVSGIRLAHENRPIRKVETTLQERKLYGKSGCLHLSSAKPPLVQVQVERHGQVSALGRRRSARAVLELFVVNSNAQLACTYGSSR